MKWFNRVREGGRVSLHELPTLVPWRGSDGASMMLVLILVHGVHHLCHGMHQLSLHSHHLLQNHSRRRRWWSIGIVDVAIAMIIVSIMSTSTTPCLSHVMCKGKYKH